MNICPEDFVLGLVKRFPPLERAYREHLYDNFGELLPHLVMADFCRLVCSGRPNESWQDDFLSELESNFSAETDDPVSNMIALSFVENLPPPGKNHFLVNRLPQKLTVEYGARFGLTR